jgi:heme oxygenase
MGLALRDLPSPLYNFLSNPPWKMLLALGISVFFGESFLFSDEPTQETDPTSLAIVSLGGYMAWKGSRKPDQKLKKTSDESQLLSTILKDETKTIHTSIEKHPFLLAILSNSLKKETYATYLRDLLEVYRALEKGLTEQKSHPKIKPIYFPEFFRSAALEKDLESFEGNAIKATPAALAYAEHINQTSKKSPWMLAAHAYARYLGDLAGGQFLAKSIRRQWGDKVASFAFPEIKSLVEAKKNFKSALNALPLTDKEKRQLADEAILSFRMSGSIFDDLVALEKKGDVTRPSRP